MSAPLDLPGVSEWARRWWDMLPQAYQRMDAEQNPELGGYPLLRFLGGAAAVLLLLFGAGTLVQRGAARLPRPRGVLPRLALANVHRPGAMTRQLVVALGLGPVATGAAMIDLTSRCADRTHRSRLRTGG